MKFFLETWENCHARKAGDWDPCCGLCACGAGARCKVYGTRHTAKGKLERGKRLKVQGSGQTAKGVRRTDCESSMSRMGVTQKRPSEALIIFRAA